MMCIISKERIAFCAQVEGTLGVVFAASPIALQSRWKRVPNEPIPTYGHSWPSPPECLFKIGDRQSEKKWWNSDRSAIYNVTRDNMAARGVIRHRGVSDGSDGARPLWRSHSARTEIFFADGRDGFLNDHIDTREVFLNIRTDSGDGLLWVQEKETGGDEHLHDHPWTIQMEGSGGELRHLAG